MNRHWDTHPIKYTLGMWQDNSLQQWTTARKGK